MVGIVGKNYNQIITYWGPGAENEFGQASASAPIKLNGRWEDRNQEITTPSGEQVVSNAQVFVDQDVDVGGYLALGDLTAQATPTTDAREIRDFRTTPDLRNLETERRAFL